jgi:hypothetical protein
MEQGTSPKVEVDDAVILILGAPGGLQGSQGRIEGITRLEKLVFLLEQETDTGKLLSEDPAFRPHHFGPFSAKVYEAIDTLVLAGLVEDSSSPSQTPDDSWESEVVVGLEPADPYATRNVALTATGHRYYEALLKEIPAATETELTDFKNRFGGVPLRQLVRYVYQKYPKMTERSVIRDDILGR